ncbi:MAG: hypothetical protein WC484_08490 [Candidatus Omnitrophota bacterium]
MLKSERKASILGYFSIVFGVLSFFGNFGYGKSELEGYVFYSTLILTLLIIALGILVISRTKKKKKVTIFTIALVGFYGLMQVSAVIGIPYFYSAIPYVLMQTIVIFPVAISMQYLLASHLEKEETKISIEEASNALDPSIVLFQKQPV